MSLGPVEYFMREREVVPLGLLLKIQGKGFCVIRFLLQKKKDMNPPSWFPLTAQTKQMQKYQVYVFCSSGKLLI